MGRVWELLLRKLSIAAYNKGHLTSQGHDLGILAVPLVEALYEWADWENQI